MEGAQGETTSVEPPTVTPFTEDSAVCRLAEDLGLEVSRYLAIEVTDLAALKAAGLTKIAPDYGRIRQLLESGATIEGAHLAGHEYKLRRPA